MNVHGLMGCLTALVLQLALHSPAVADALKVEAERYVAIGDSYTIGEGVSEDDRFPNQLVKLLEARGIILNLVANPSRTGWTTREALERELPVLERARPTFVTLLIGVNDWVRGGSEETFRANLTYLIRRITAALPERRRLVLVTIPDFSVTPAGPRFGRPGAIAEGIRSFNRIIGEEAAREGLEVVDIYPISLRAALDAELTASDGLHPSAKQYALWAQAIALVADRVLSKNQD